MTKRVIVTGANGFVGCNIVAAFLDAGWVVNAVDHVFDNPAYSHLSAERLRLIASDCANLAPLAAEALVHAAAITATPAARGESPEANLHANLDSLLSIMEYAHRQRIGRAVFISSAAVFGSTPATPIDETRPPQPLGVYGVAKALLEDVVETMRHEYGRDVACARLGGIYGPYEFVRSSRPKLSLVAQMISAALGRRMIEVVRSEEQRQWTYAPDIGRALVALMNAEKLSHGLYNLACGERLSDLEVARQLASLIDGLTVRNAAGEEVPDPPSSRLGWLDNSRLRRDVGFSDWTNMSERTLEPTLDSIREGIANA